MVDSLPLQAMRQPSSSSNPTNRITHPQIFDTDIAGIRTILVHAISERSRQSYEERGFIASPMDPMTLMITVSEALKVCVGQPFTLLSASASLLSLARAPRQISRSRHKGRVC